MRVVLQVEDNEGDAELLRAAIDDTGVDLELHVVPTATAAFSFLQRRGGYADAPTPDVMLLDINLPLMGGLSFLNILKNHEEWRLLPVIVLSSSRAGTDLDQARELGAARYVIKPDTYDRYLDVARVLAQVIEGAPQARRE